jgi:hypothetical protein
MSIESDLLERSARQFRSAADVDKPGHPEAVVPAAKPVVPPVVVAPKAKGKGKARG